MKIFELFATIGLDDKEFIQGVSTARNNFASFGESVFDIGDKIAGIGQSLTNKLTTPIIGAAKSAIQLGMDFQQGLSKIAAITGATTQEMDLMGRASRDMAVEFGVGATDIVKAFQFIAETGGDVDNMLDDMRASLLLTKASGEDFSMTTEFMASMMKIFGSESVDAEYIANVLASTISVANTNVGELAYAMQYAAPTAKDLGYSIDDTAIALAVMAENGLTGSIAGTSLSRVLMNMISPSDGVYAAMQRVGISLEDNAGNIKPLNQLMGEMQEAFRDGGFAITETELALFNMSEEERKAYYETNKWTKSRRGANEEIMDMLGLMEEGTDGTFRMTEAQKAQLTLTIAGSAGFKALSAILGTTTEDMEWLTDSIYDSQDAFEGQGQAAGMAAIQNDNLSGRIELLKTRVQELALKAFEILLPYLEKGIEWLGKMLTKFENLDEGGLKFIMTIAGIVAAIGPLIVIIGTVVKAIATIGTAITTVKGVLTAFKVIFAAVNAVMLASPIGLVVAAVALLTAGITSAIVIFGNWKKSILTVEEAAKQLEKAQLAVSEATQEVDDAFGSYINAIDNATEAKKRLQEAEKAAGQTGKELYDLVKSGVITYDDMTDIQLELYKAYLQNAQAQMKLQNSSEALDKATVNLTKAKEDETKAFWNSELALAAQDKSFKKAGESAKVFGEDVVAAWKRGEISTGQAQEVLSKAMTVMSNKARDTFTKEFPDAINEGLNPKAYETTGEKITNWFKNVGNNMVSGFKKIFGIASPSKVMIEIAGNVMDGFQSGAEKKEDGVKARLTTMFAGFLDSTKELPGKFLEKGSEIVDKFRDGAGNVITGAVGKVKDFFGGFPDSIKDFPQNFLDRGKDIVDKFRDGAGNVIGGAVDKVKGFFDGFPKSTEKLPEEFNKQGKETVNKYEGGIAGAISDAVYKVSNSFDKFKDSTKGIQKEMNGAGKNSVDGFVEGVNSTINSAVEKVKGFFGKISQSVKDFLGIKSPSTLFAEFGDDTVEGYVEGIERNEYAIEKVGEVFKVITSQVEDLPDAFEDIGENLVMSFTDGIEYMTRAITGAITDAFGSIIDIIKDVFGIETKSEVFEELGETSIESFVEGIEDAAKLEFDTVEEIFDEVIEIAEEVTDEFWELGKSIVDNFVDGLMENATRVKTAIQEVFGSVSDDIKVSLNVPSKVTATNKLAMATARETTGEGERDIYITQNIQTVPQTPSEFASTTKAAFEVVRWQL